MNGSNITLPDGSSFSIIKPLIGFRPEIEQQLKRFPYEKNVFLMMRFRDANKQLSDFIIDTLKTAGLNGVRADDDDWSLTHDVYNTVAVLYCCKYGIALFDEAEPNQAYNSNVIYELGMMHCLGRECLILRNDSLPTVPFDLIKNFYMPYKGDLAVRTNIQRWLKRFTPHTAASLPVPSKGESNLVTAAVAAPEDSNNGDKVVASPEEIATAAFGWQVSSKTEKKWRVSWSIKLTNNRKRSISVRVQVLFLDESGFALDDHTSALTRLPKGKMVTVKETLSMSPDLANRVQRALARVSTASQVINIID